MDKIKVGDVLEIELDRMTYGASAVGRYNNAERSFLASGGLAVFVEGAIPGERVRAMVKKVHKRYVEAQCVEVLKPSPNRLQPRCPVFEICGGCQWQHLNYAEQLKQKKQILSHFLKVDEIECFGAENPWNYRARAQVNLDQKGLGFYQKRSHQIAYVSQCSVLCHELQSKWTDLEDKIKQKIFNKPLPAKVEWHWDGKSVSQVFNEKHSALGFSQINIEQNRRMVELVKECAGHGAFLLDLYGGSGNLSNGLVENFESIISVDLFGNETAFLDQTQNALKKGRVFIKESSENFLRSQLFNNAKSILQKFQPDCVIADPPRAGLEKVAELLVTLAAKKLVLVSCDPATLSRDLAVLKSKYLIERVMLVDMFPQTYHIETVVLLKAA